jgi:hypothetical protein
MVCEQRRLAQTSIQLLVLGAGASAAPNRQVTKNVRKLWKMNEEQNSVFRLKFNSENCDIIENIRDQIWNKYFGIDLKS